MEPISVFEDAKPALKEMLERGEVLPKPICLKTLRILLKAPVGSPLEFLLEALSREKLQDLAKLECFVLPAFASIEYHGLYIDQPAWNQEIQIFKRKLVIAKEQAQKLLSSPKHLNLFGESDLNLDSSLEIKVALEKILGTSLPDLRQKTLMACKHEASEALLAYRNLNKWVQSYGDSFLEQINPKDSRLRATFEPLGTSTGRVACHNPNLQSLPSEPKFQACLTAPPGKQIVKADYAACELRILADFSGDPVFLKAFEQDLDLHAEVALELFGNVAYRERAKAINFGLIYGMGSKSLAKSLSVSEPEAEQLLENYFKKHKAIRDYLQDCTESAYKNGFVETCLGRKLYLDTAQDISRIAKNMPIQGTAAEITKLAMIGIHEKLASFSQAFLVNMIHDELVVECLEQDAEQISQLLQEEMESAQRRLIPKVKPKASCG